MSSCSIFIRSFPSLFRGVSTESVAADVEWVESVTASLGVTRGCGDSSHTKTLPLRNISSKWL